MSHRRATQLPPHISHPQVPVRVRPRTIQRGLPAVRAGRAEREAAAQHADDQEQHGQVVGELLAERAGEEVDQRDDTEGAGSVRLCVHRGRVPGRAAA